MTASTTEERETNDDAASPVVEPEATPPQPWSFVPTTALDVVLVTLATLLILTVIFELWDGGLRIPFTYDGDALGLGTYAQNIIEKGWIYQSDRIGAPFGSDVRDYVSGGDNLNWLGIRILAFGTGDWVLVNNLFFLLTFPAAAVSALLALRWLGASRATAAVAAILFAFAPYHFIRGTEHMFLASYAVVPIGVVLAVRVWRGEGPFLALREHPRRWLSTVGWVALCAVVGSSGTYYAVFLLLLIATAALLGFARGLNRRPLVAAASTGAVVVVVQAVNVAPSLLYAREHGKNLGIAQRQIFENDVFGLRFVQMLTPIPGHRLAALREFSADLMNGPYNSEASMFLGAVGALALLAMLGSLLVRVVRPSEAADDRSLLEVLAVVSILIATIGGLSWFLGLAGLEEIRSWNRMSIVVGFLALAWGALTVDRLVARVPRTRAKALLLLVPVVIVLGVADQTSSSVVEDRDAWAAEFRADQEFFTELERQLPDGAMVFQLPVVRYPESGPILESGDYDLMRPYLSTNDLHWSYGGIRGRESEWQQTVHSKPVPEMVDDIVAAGFSGILVDTYAYADRAAALSEALTAVTNSEPVASSTGRWLYFDLTNPVAEFERTYSESEREALRAAVLEKPVYFTEHCFDHEIDASTMTGFHWCEDDGQLIFDNYADDARVQLDLSFTTANGLPTTITLDLPEEAVTLYTDDEGRADTTVEVELPRGRTIVPFESDAAAHLLPPDLRTFYLRVEDPKVTLVE